MDGGAKIAEDLAALPLRMTGFTQKSISSHVPVPAFQEAIRLNPSSPEAHLELGKTELAVGRANHAIVELEEALHLSPTNVHPPPLLTQPSPPPGDPQPPPHHTTTSPH